MFRTFSYFVSNSEAFLHTFKTQTFPPARFMLHTVVVKHPRLQRIATEWFIKMRMLTVYNAEELIFLKGVSLLIAQTFHTYYASLNILLTNCCT